MGLIVDRVEVTRRASPICNKIFPSGSAKTIAPLCRDSTIAPRLTSTSTGSSLLIR